MIRHMLAFTILALIALPAQAQDYFSGFYVGATGGYEDIELNVSVDGTEFDLASPQGIFYGGFVGYRRHLGSGIVLGLEGFATSSDADDELVGALGPVVIHRDINWGFDAIGGYLVTPRALVFASAGYMSSVLETQEAGLVSDEDFDVFRIGGGIEFALGRGFSVRGGGRALFYDSSRLTDAIEEALPGMDIESDVFGWQGFGAVVFTF